MTAKAPPRVALDTNVVLSALVFRGGPAGRVRAGWQSGRFVPLGSGAPGAAGSDCDDADCAPRPARIRASATQLNIRRKIDTILAPCNGQVHETETQTYIGCGAKIAMYIIFVSNLYTFCVIFWVCAGFA